jgi:hypothetical protein
MERVEVYCFQPFEVPLCRNLLPEFEYAFKPFNRDELTVDKNTGVAAFGSTLPFFK